MYWLNILPSLAQVSFSLQLRNTSGAKSRTIRDHFPHLRFLQSLTLDSFDTHKHGSVCRHDCAAGRAGGTFVVSQPTFTERNEDCDVRSLFFVVSFASNSASRSKFCFSILFRRWCYSYSLSLPSPPSFAAAWWSYSTASTCSWRTKNPVSITHKSLKIGSGPSLPCSCRRRSFLPRIRRWPLACGGHHRWDFWAWSFPDTPCTCGIDTRTGLPLVDS